MVGGVGDGITVSGRGWWGECGVGGGSEESESDWSKCSTFEPLLQ